MEFDFGRTLKRELRVDTMRCTSLPISLFDIYGGAQPRERAGPATDKIIDKFERD